MRSAEMAALFGVASCWMAASARADEALLAPRPGFSYTVRNETKNTTGADTFEQVSLIERKILSSDGPTSKASSVITFVSNKQNGAEEAVDFIPVPGPNTFNEFMYFLPTEISMEFDLNRKDQPPGRHISRSRVDCDKAGVASFFPLGTTSSVAVNCTTATSLDGRGTPPQDAAMALSYEGRTSVETPAGKFHVHQIRQTIIQTGRKTESVILFDEGYGIAISSTVRVEAANVSFNSHVEVIAMSK